MAGPLSDPRARRAYLATKAAVLLLLAGVTWLLSIRLGPRVWLGFALFAILLAALTAAVLALAGRPGTAAAPPEPEAHRDGEDEPALPDPAVPVVLPVEDALDLHPFPPADIPDVVWDYVDAAHAAGLREVRLIHGRGIGVQRERVRAVLARHPLVRSFADAPPERGGWGATVAHLNDS